MTRIALVALKRPRRLQIGAVMVIGVLIVIVLWPLLRPADGPARLQQAPTPIPPTAQALQRFEPSGDPLHHIAAYNTASIVAGATGRAEDLRPFLTADGKAWADIQREFTQRARDGETHSARLVRWGIVGQEMHPTTAVIETQEVWDDQTYLAGNLVDARHGIMLRLRYHMTRPAQEAHWKISSIETRTVMP